MRLHATRRAAIAQGRGLGNPLWDLAGSPPSLDLRFAESKSLVDATTGANLVTFTRSSTGTYIDSDGLIKTAATNEARFDHNPTTGESLGPLVEEQRSNLLLNSAALATQNITVTAVAHTLSFYGTGTVILSGAHSATVVGTGAYPARTTLTFTPTAGTLTVTVSGTVEYANLETGSGGAAASFATSWIPTTNATATRSADVAIISGSNYSGWFNATEGSLYVEAQSFQSTAATNVIAVISDATLSNRWEVDLRAGSLGGVGRTTVVSGGSTVFDTGNVTSPAFAVNQTYKIASAAAADNFGYSFNGGAAVQDSSGAMPISPVRMEIGNRLGALVLNGTIKRLTYWPQRLPNSTLQAITL